MTTLKEVLDELNVKIEIGNCYGLLGSYEYSCRVGSTEYQKKQPV